MKTTVVLYRLWTDAVEKNYESCWLEWNTYLHYFDCIWTMFSKLTIKTSNTRLVRDTGHLYWWKPGAAVGSVTVVICEQCCSL